MIHDVHQPLYLEQPLTQFKEFDLRCDDSGGGGSYILSKDDLYVPYNITTRPTLL